MGALILLFIATITAVSALIDTSRYEYYNHRPKATYSDIMKAMFLVDFNLNLLDLDNLELLVGPKVFGKIYTGESNETFTEDFNAKYWMTYDGYKQAIIQMELISKTFAAVKSHSEYRVPTYNQFFNALYMALNYDFMGQILDPNYKVHFVKILPVPLLKQTWMSTFRRWKVDLTGMGTRNMTDIIRGSLSKLSKEEREQVNRHVYRLYLHLDEYVLNTLNKAADVSPDIRIDKRNYLQPKATNTDIMNAADLIDLQLSEMEINWIEAVEAYDLKGHSPELADNCAKELFQIRLWFANQNTHMDENTRKKRFLNALYLIINYDAMGQILDPNYEPKLLNFTRAVQEGNKCKDTRQKMPAMKILHNRWTQDITGVGLESPGMIKWSDRMRLRSYLYQYFDKNSEKDMEEMKYVVYKMRSRLDKLVLDALNAKRYSTSQND